MWLEVSSMEWTEFSSLSFTHTLQVFMSASWVPVEMSGDT